MSKRIFDLRMKDGSRHFFSMPDSFYPWQILRGHLSTIPGASEKNFVSDGVLEFWLDFDFRGYLFSINNAAGDLWFFSEDPDCPEEILSEIADHFEGLPT